MGVTIVIGEFDYLWGLKFPCVSNILSSDNSQFGKEHI